MFNEEVSLQVEERVSAETGKKEKKEKKEKAE